MSARDFKVGDMVVFAWPEDQIMDWHGWRVPFDPPPYKIVKVDHYWGKAKVDCGWGDVTGHEKGWWFPVDQLELLEEKPERTTQPAPEPKYNAKCPRCGSPAYLGLTEVECSRYCSDETTKRSGGEDRQSFEFGGARWYLPNGVPLGMP